MSFMKTVVENNLPIWNNCMDTPFIQELWTGKLPENKFKEYMIQDSIYLKHYARVYGQAIYCSKRLKDIQTFYSILNFVTDTESAVRIRYLKKYGVTDDDTRRADPFGNGGKERSHLHRPYRRAARPGIYPPPLGYGRVRGIR